MSGNKSQFMTNQLSVSESVDGELSAIDVVLAYHERTKHHLHRYAAALGYMDWATQPNPFRRYDGASLLRLPLAKESRELPYWRLFVPSSVTPVPLSIDSISVFFRYALSLTAWKSHEGAMWSLRANPSSGNLHPTEGYAVLPALAAVQDRPGVYHYAPKEHGLERRADCDPSLWQAMMADFPVGSFLVGLSSIHWREAWKYGERAFRYCQHDVGHALGTMRFGAAALGWQLYLVDGVSSAVVSQLLGLNRDIDYVGAERENAELLALIVPGELNEFRSLNGPPNVRADAVVEMAAASKWHGLANCLSAEHSAHWEVIDEVAQATLHQEKCFDEGFTGFPSEEELFIPPVRVGLLSAETAIQQRRSAQSMDASTAISAHIFFQMLARLVPTKDKRSIPWDAIAWRPRIHLGLFVHRVTGLTPGIYALVRDPDKLESIQKAFHQDFLWQRPPSCPPGLALYLLKAGDCRSLAAGVSCGQDIAGDGAFSLGMIADYTESLEAYGAAFYNNLFWEAGLVGSVLYLEAEEAGVRATGIGCYFDDPVHEVLGISSRDWQSFYHFTVGGALEDSRLTTLPGYNRGAE
jgi:SagB-type dehydrogenase family enzyme